MQADKEGFLFPHADLSACVDCKKCVNVCPIISSNKTVELQEAYAGSAADETVVKKSASGGAFSLLVDAFLKMSNTIDSYICGVIWDVDFKESKHIIIGGSEGYDAMCSSKYIQSRKGDIYLEIEKILKAGKKVLFSGTPCEAAALRKYLKQDYNGLYIIDIVCQGPTTPKAMNDFISVIEKKNKSKIIGVNMRHVEMTPWIPQWIRLCYANGKTQTKVFYETAIGRAVHILQRKSCYDCHFCGKKHVADITIGDYHGVDPKATYYNPNGTSIVIVNTRKGKFLFEHIESSKEKFQSAQYDLIAKTNPRLVSTWQPHKLRDAFGIWLAEEGLFGAAKKSWSTRQKFRILLPYRLRLLVREVRKKCGRR